MGWYPIGAWPFRPDNQFLLVANGKGLASRPSWPADGQVRRAGATRASDSMASGRIFQGCISFIARPDNAQMVAYTEQVRRNSSLHARSSSSQAPVPSDSVIPGPRR